jgi:PKD repeat protein
MTIPSSSKFPDILDNDDNLFLVHDSLRVRLAEDYSPGDKMIYVEGDDSILVKFPDTGIITLTEQCGDIDKRALSFYYSSPPRSFPYSFEGLEILPEFSDLDSVKTKKITNVTMNVLDLHHNHLKDALIKVQEFVGTKYDPDVGTITQRIERLKSIALAPKAWFTANVLYGISPLKVILSNESLRIGKEYTKQKWTFSSSSSGSYEEIVEKISNNSLEYESEKVLEKTFTAPGLYTIKLRVENEYGNDEVEFEDMIVVRTECPEEAIIRINHRTSQKYTEGDFSSGIKPKIRSVANTFIDLEVPDGENPDRLGYSYAGEELGPPGPPIDQRKIDPIIEYTWRLGDILPHSSSRFARASYDIGGYYDITLRVDTSFGSYRITSYDSSIDIVEKSNLWMFNYDDYNSNSSGNIQAYEFGLKSETFKTMGTSVPYLDRDNSFLSSPPLNYSGSTLERAKNEFENNVEFTRASSSDSGESGDSLIFWAKGGATVDLKQILLKKYNGFNDVYENLSTINDRPWNWVALSSPEKTYFLLGQFSPVSPGANRTVPEKVEYDLGTTSSGLATSLPISFFENGADELLNSPYQIEPSSGFFASYRSAWKGQTGYILRNSSVNEFFRFGHFYKTKGSLSSPFGSITKMPDMPGSIKIEGQLVPLFNGVFFFNNSGEICAWNDTSLSWEVGRASSTSLSFRSVQDASAQNFDDRSNTLKASSDGDRMAYLSYDYSRRAFVKFNGTDLTFTILKQRPEGKQFKIGVY